MNEATFFAFESEVNKGSVCICLCELLRVRGGTQGCKGDMHVPQQASEGEDTKHAPLTSLASFSPFWIKMSFVFCNV